MFCFSYNFLVQDVGLDLVPIIRTNGARFGVSSTTRLILVQSYKIEYTLHEKESYYYNVQNLIHWNAAVYVNKAAASLIGVQ